MDTQELDRMAQKARRETEDFLNNYIHDRAKGWPLFRGLAPEYAGSRQIGPLRTRGSRPTRG